MQISTHVRIAFSLFFAAAVLVPASQAATMSQGERALLTAVNAARAAHELAPLEVDPALTRAAQGHSRTLLRTNTFAHGPFAARLARSGARGPVLAENLGWGKGSRATAAGIVRGWLASPGHRANLLRPGFTRIGLGTRTGTFLGVRGATVVTANFAGR